MVSSGLASWVRAQAYLILDLLGIVGRGAQGHGDVVGHLIARDRDHRGVVNGAVDEDRDVGGPAADVGQAHPQLLFVVGQDRLAGGELLEDHVVHLEPAAAHAFHDVLGGAHGPGDEMDLGLQPHAGHPHRLPDPLLLVDDELLGEDVQDLLVGRDRHRARGVDDAIDVAVGDLAVADRDDPVRIEAADMAAGDPGIDRSDLAAGHELGLFDGPLYGLHRGLDVDHDALSEAARRIGADPDHLDRAIAGGLPDDRDHLGGADVEPHDQILVRPFHRHPPE